MPYTPLGSVGPARLWRWDSDEAFIHTDGDCEFVYAGALVLGEDVMPISTVFGCVYHSTPEIWRAQAICRDGFNLSHRLVGRSHGDGVYARRIDSSATPASAAVVRIGLDGAVLLDTSAGDGAYQRLQATVPSLERLLIAQGIQGISCSWGVVLYDLPPVEALAWRPAAG